MKKDCCEEPTKEKSLTFRIPLAGLLISAFTILTLIGGFFLATGSGPAKLGGGGDGQAYTDHTSFEWGEININGGNDTPEFAIENRGTGELELANILTSCACTSAQITIEGVVSPYFGMHSEVRTNDPLNRNLSAGAGAGGEDVGQLQLAGAAVLNRKFGGVVAAVDVDLAPLEGSVVGVGLAVSSSSQLCRSGTGGQEESAYQGENGKGADEQSGEGDPKGAGFFFCWFLAAGFFHLRITSQRSINSLVTSLDLPDRTPSWTQLFMCSSMIKWSISFIARWIARDR